MKYATFVPKEQESINGFLQENSEHLVQGGVYVFADRIVFLYNDEPEEARRRRLLLGSLRQGLLELNVKLASQEAECRFWAGESLKGGNPERVVKAKEAKKEILAQIHYTEQVIEDIEKNGGISEE